MNFQYNLKELRRIKGIGQRDLAKILQTTEKTISHWETGYTEPSLKQLCDLANYFDVTTDELLGREED